MKKIGIITFTRAHNYGSILQGYALQKYISENFDCECELIDYSNKGQQQAYNLFKKGFSIKNIIKNCLAFIFYPILKREYNDFENFINKNLKLTKEKYTNKEEIEKISDKYDIYISGSDQVWNINCLDADDVYFLNFVKNGKKVAYAPSFGAQNILECSSNPEKYSDLIKSYDNVSIREINGKKWIKELTGIDAPLLIDPTLFYDKEDWQKLMSEPILKKPYILYYAFHFTQEVNKIVKKISKKYKMPVVILSSHAYVYNICGLYGFKLAKHSSPAEFLRLVNDAEMVFSTSFHGTVFSALFKKNFWFLYGAIQDKTDDRALTLVKQLGIEERVIKTADVDNTDLLKLPDYSSFDKKLNELRNDAFNYLKKSINNK